MENEELVEQIKAGNNKTKYLEQLYLQNRNFIYGIAKKYSPYAEMDDLMQEAYFGLVKAVEGFESKQGANFLTYLAYWLQSVFRRYIDNFRNTKRISASMRERILKYKKYLAECAKMEQTATDYAICRELNISEKQLANLRKTIYEAECISVNELLPGSDNLTIEEAIADPLNMEEGIVDTLSEEWLKVQLWKIVRRIRQTKGLGA